MSETAVCEFCGQVFMSNLQTEPERHKEAIMRCTCPGAYHMQKRWRKIDDAEIELLEVMEYNPFSGASDYAVDEETTKDIRVKLEAFIPNLVDGDIKALTVQIPGIGKVTMASTDKNIKISKRITTGVERKIES